MTCERTFPALGTTVRLIAPAAAPLDAVETFIRDAHATLTRFDPASELSRLNTDSRRVVPASPLLCAAVAAARWAAERTGGHGDPTLLEALEAAGNDRTIAALQRATLPELSPAAPARPHPARAWVTVRVLAGAIVREPGVRLDLGGTAKGLLADLAAHQLGAGCIVDCGGDIRVRSVPVAPNHVTPVPESGTRSTRFHGSGTDATRFGADRPDHSMPPFTGVRTTAGHRPDAPATPASTLAIQVEHPVTGAHVHTLQIADGAVATSAIGRRAWRAADGRVAHHLIDPATGRPAATSLAGVTALAPTALEAEALAKAALLTGSPDHLEHGGVLLHADGSAEPIPPRSPHGGP